MNLLKRIFNQDKKDFKASEQKKNDDIQNIKRNDAFEYIKNKYGIDCNIYRKLSSVIYDHSIAAANEFAEVIGGKSNEDLIHFFFDYFLCFYVTAKPDNFHSANKDVYSALVDGIHIEHYGNVSDQVIESTLDLFSWITKDKCFLKTDIALFKERDAGDRLRFVIAIASYCAGIEVGAIEGLNLAVPFREIQNSKLSSIDTFFKVFKKN
jgi:hypothetical protein